MKKSIWIDIERPGYFGRARDQKMAEFNTRFGQDNWRLVWKTSHLTYFFHEACKYLYEKSYFEYLKDRTEDLDYICSFSECMDNAPTNVQSGLDYTIQEAFSNHIQDIAVRNILNSLGRKFESSTNEILIIRRPEDSGYRFNPGNIPFFDPTLISQPSLCPAWAKPSSVEDFWQSNKWLQQRVIQP